MATANQDEISVAGVGEGRNSPSSLAINPSNFIQRRLQGHAGQHSTGPRQTIDNPLLAFDDTIQRPNTHKTELEEYVFNFASRSNLEDKYELLLFGARLARDKHEALSRYHDEITLPEKNLIDSEDNKHTGFWKQSKFFRATIMTASLAGMIQGWTQSTNNGTMHGMPEEFGLCISRSDACNVRTKDMWVLGMLNAICLLSAAVFGTTLADPLQERYLGRRGSVMVSCCITVASTIGASTTHNVTQLAICRAINGIALGAKASIVPIYSAEISPEHIRGAILANWQLADAAGIFFGFLMNLIVIIYVDNIFQSWRILTNTVLIPTVPLLVLIYLMPESPRYLMKHGRYREALKSFEMIQTTPLLASRDFIYAHAQLDLESRLVDLPISQNGMPPPASTMSQRSISPMGGVDAEVVENVQEPRNSAQTGSSRQRPDTHRESTIHTGIELANFNRRASDISSLDIELARRKTGRKENPYYYHIGVTGYFKRLRELRTNPRCRRALLSASICMIVQQLTGVNTIAILGTTAWQTSLGSSSNPKINAGIGLVFGAMNYLCGLPAYWMSDRVGRSILLAIGLPNMAWSMLAFALLFHIPEDSPARIPLVSVAAVIFVAFYSPTAGTSPFSIAAEVFPLVSREVGMAVSVMINLGGAGLLVLVFPPLLNKIGPTPSWSIFAGLNLIAFFLVYLFVPETRRRTLEELQFTFDLKTRWHVEYRVVYIRRWFMRNWWKILTRQEVRPPIPFYRWARITHAEEEDED